MVTNKKGGIYLLEKNEKIEVVCHLVNGWSAVLFIKPLIAGVGVTGLILIILGWSKVFKIFISF